MKTRLFLAMAAGLALTGCEAKEPASSSYLPTNEVEAARLCWKAVGIPTPRDLGTGSKIVYLAGIVAAADPSAKNFAEKLGDVTNEPVKPEDIKLIKSRGVEIRAACTARFPLISDQSPSIPLPEPGFDRDLSCYAAAKFLGTMVGEAFGQDTPGVAELEKTASAEISNLTDVILRAHDITSSDEFGVRRVAALRDMVLRGRLDRQLSECPKGE